MSLIRLIISFFFLKAAFSFSVPFASLLNNSSFMLNNYDSQSDSVILSAEFDDEHSFVVMVLFATSTFWLEPLRVQNFRL